MFSLEIQERKIVAKITLLDLLFSPYFNNPYNYMIQVTLNAN
ncbi:hypothetical protein HNQ37_000807 [Lactovum miscens]|uniref:Uncharacterized protein n=1 Tax=Lactovum miscens TaxID=190387 RepID=A0A841C6L4_9LACT|nr:hypothetical protein [Lactovum miscens]